MDRLTHIEAIQILEARFQKNRHRHEGIDWASVLARIQAHPQKLDVLIAMEQTGGEPDVIGTDLVTGAYFFCDCSPESPLGRRSLCYDREAHESRKENKPKGNALDMAKAIGIEILTEDQYRQLQGVGEFDRKTSSWIQTPPPIRSRGGALFCDRRYDHIFVYHNGAESYYAARGFRGRVAV